jgi:hypothetical protein
MSDLLAQTQAVYQLTVLIGVCSLEVIQELAPAAHHAQQAAPRMVVFDVSLEVFSEVRDARRQQRNLDFR